MNIGKWLLTLVLLFMFAFSGVLTAKISFAESHAKVTERNPFRSLLPTNTTATSLAQTLSKSASTKKNSSVQKKKVLKKTVVAKVVSQLPEIKPAVETDISSREKQLAKILKLKDILETSEGRYAFIDEKKVSYIVQEGEWLDSVFVREIYKNSVELQEIDGETTLILVLQP